MAFDPEQWCDDLIKELHVDNTVRTVGKKYSADGKLLHCKLVINNGSVSFLVCFSISNEGYLLSPSVRPGFHRDYNKYGSRKYGRRKHDARKYGLWEYSPLEVEHHCSVYLTQSLGLKPNVKNFRDEIVKIRSFWLSDDQFSQLLNSK